MNLLIFSDLHIHNYKTYSKDGLGLDRLDSCLRVLDDMFNEAHEAKINKIIFCGDLYHQQGQVPTEVIVATTKRFAQLFAAYPDIMFIAISGNHDYATKNLYGKRATSALEALATVFKQFVLLDLLPDEGLKIDGEHIVGIPYYEYPEDFLKHLSDVKTANPDTSNITLLIHQTPPMIPMIKPDFEYEHIVGFKQVLCGHIHTKSRVKEYNLTVLGSPIQHSLEDAGQKRGFYIIEDDAVYFYSLNEWFPTVRVVGNDTEDELNVRSIDYVHKVTPIVEVLDKVSVDISDKFDPALSKQELFNNYVNREGLPKATVETGKRLIDLP